MNLNDLNPMQNITNMLGLGPMPVERDQVPEGLIGLAMERPVNPHNLWHALQMYWPSHIIPLYTIPERWVWSWYAEDDAAVWEIVGLC